MKVSEFVGILMNCAVIGLFLLLIWFMVASEVSRNRDCEARNGAVISYGKSGSIICENKDTRAIIEKY